MYILHSHINAHVPTSAVKGILTQPDPKGKREKWIAALLEYDIEIRPTKLIKGQGLANMLTDSNCESLQLNFLSCQSNRLDTGVEVMIDFTTSPWYFDIVHVLQNLHALAGLNKTRARSVKLKAAKFCILNQYIY